MRAVANVVWMSVWGVVLLAGCANLQGMPGASSGNQNDFITDSDEPDARRRARLRVELATGYFEQGQTKIALDEIKQALTTDPTYVEAFNLRGLVYMRLNDDEKTVTAMDVLVPGIGEVIGGAQREERMDQLLANMKSHNLKPEDYWWYLELRRYGSVPHAGFGMGIERVVAWVCGLDHVRETIPFARTLHRIYP